MANTIAAFPELSTDVWADPDGPYNVRTGPQGVGAANVDHLIRSVAEHGAAYVPDGLNIAQERRAKLQAAAYADAKALATRGHADKRVADRVRTQAEQFAQWLREFDDAHGTWSGQMSPTHVYFDREDGAGREFVRQEWAAHSGQQ